MIIVSGSVVTSLPPEQAATYLFEFEHTSHWDPGTPVVNKISIGPPRPGSRYYAEAQFPRKRRFLEYEILQLSSHHIKLRGESRSLIMYTTIDVQPASDGSSRNNTGSEVAYINEIELRGWRKAAKPLTIALFNSRCTATLNGLQKKLDSLTRSTAR